MVDITDIPQAQMWDEAVLMGNKAMTKSPCATSPS